MEGHIPSPSIVSLVVPLITGNAEVLPFTVIFAPGFTRLRKLPLVIYLLFY